MDELTPNSSASSPGTGTAHQHLRFNTISLMAITVMISMIAAFMRPFGETGFLSAALAVLVAIVAGVICGRFGNVNLSLFWALCSAAIIQIVTVDEMLSDATGHYAWPVIAAILGAVLAVMNQHVLVRMLVGSCVATVLFVFYVLVCELNFTTMMPELICAPLGGAMQAVLIESARIAESRGYVSQIAIAFILIIASIGFAILGPMFVPGL